MKLVTCALLTFLSVVNYLEAETNIQDINVFKESMITHPAIKISDINWIPEDLNLREKFKLFINKLANDSDAEGLSVPILTRAFKFFEENREGLIDKTFIQKAMDKGENPDEGNDEKISNQNFISIVNYELARSVKRHFILNLNEGKIYSSYAAHGYGSNKSGKKSKIPEIFGSKKDSGMTSPGFYLTGKTYCSSSSLKNFGKCRGENKANAVKLDGLEEKNWNARIRGIVFHGASYVDEDAGAEGNSAGCVAVPISLFDKFHQNLKNGSLVYVHAEP